LAAPRTISRFGRTYVEFDPDGGGGGPSTWVLAAAGGGAGAAIGSGAPGGTFSPPPPPPGGTGSACQVGMALFFTTPGKLDLALAMDATIPGQPAPYQVAGLASIDAVDGQLVGLISDGQISRADWTPVAGGPDLVPGARYYLSSSSAGWLQLACPSGVGATVVCVGQALSERVLEVEINLIARL
jgi:hypothetical protein